MKRQVFLLSILLTAVAADARLVPCINLAKDIPDSDVVAIVKVENVITTAKGVPLGQFHLDELNVSCRVLYSIKGDYSAGKALNFLHYKAAQTAEQAIINGFSSFRFQPGNNYLLILNKNQDGRLQLPAPEDFSIPEFSEKLLELIPDPQEKTPLQQVVEILLLSFMSEEENPSNSLKNLRSLQQTRLFPRWLRGGAEFKGQIIQRLDQIKEASPGHYNDVAHVWLPQFGVFDHLDKAIEFVLNQNNRQSDRFNAISGWLTNYPEEMQLQACKKIVELCEDDFVRGNAETRLKYLWELPREVEERLERLLNVSDKPFIIEDFIKSLSEYITGRPKGSAFEAPKDPEKWQNIHQKILLHFKAALDSKHPEVRRRAALVLHKFQDNSGVKVLINDYQTDDENHRGNVVAALRVIKDKAAIPVLIKAAEDKSPYIRVVALEALGELKAVEAFDIIVKHLTDKERINNTCVQTLPAQAACYALGQIGIPEAIEPLIKALDDDELQGQAVMALNEIRKNGFRSGPIHFGRSSLAFPEDPGDDPIKWKRWGQWYLLNDVKVNVRVYPDWEKHPADFTLEQTSIKDNRIQLGPFKSKNGAVIVVLPDDQDSKLLKQLLKKRIYAADTTKGLYDMRVPYHGNLDRADIKDRLDKLPVLYLDDAIGNPIENPKVELFLYRYKGPRVRLGLYQTDGKFDNFMVEGNIIDKELIVTHPKYGTASAYLPQTMDIRPHIILPIVHVESEAANRSVWGYVVDPEGAPIAGAEVSCNSLRLLGGIPRHVYALSHRYKSITDEKGFFLCYPPLADKSKPFALDSNLISRKATYHLKIDPPGFAYSVYTGSVQNGVETTIELKRKAISEFTEDINEVDHKRFHNFEFYDQHGEITNPEYLKAILIDIIRPNQPKVTLRGSQLAKGLEVPNGTFKARLERMTFKQPRDFPELKVTDESPETLIFELQLLKYTGKVVHGRTKEPMQGVFVLAMNTSCHGNLSMVTDEQWEKLHELPEKPLLDDPVLQPFRDTYLFENIVRTDKDGRFEMYCPEGKTPYGFVFFEQNYVGQMHRRYILKPDENGIVQIPTKTMYPAAKVSFQANSDKRHISIGPKWLIDRKNSPDWVKYLLKCGDGSEKDFTYDKWVKHNKIQSVYVPADVTLKLRLRTPYEEDVDDFTFQQDILLTQGQVINLGECQFEGNVSFYVKVVDAGGQPLDGVPVRKKTGRSYGINISTDSNGLAEFWSGVGTKGEICVCSWDIDREKRPHIIDSVEFHIKSRHDKGAVLILQMSTEMIKLLDL